MNKKSDVRAKNAFIQNLSKRGFKNARVINSPSDIIAIKNGEKYYFE